MSDVLKLLIEKLPVKFVATVLMIVLAWFGVLTVVALLTNRSVEFFPPRIGTDQTLIAEIKGLSARATQLEQREQAHRTRLLEIVVKAREESISLQRFNSFGTADAAINVTKSEEALRVEDEKFLSKIHELGADVQRLVNRL